MQIAQINNNHKKTKPEQAKIKEIEKPIDYSSNNSKSSSVDLAPEELIRLRKNKTDRIAPLTNINQNTIPQTR